MPERQHGTRSKYVTDKCRCDLCREANSRYYHESKRRQAPSFVMAHRARRHLKDLRDAGVGKRQMASAAGVSESAVSNILKGVTTRIRPDTERALLGVTPKQAADGALIDGEQTWRNIETLLERGWTKAAIARALGNQVHHLQVRRDRVQAGTARTIEQLLDLPVPDRLHRFGSRPVDVPDEAPKPGPTEQLRAIHEGDTSWMRRGACRVNKVPTWVFYPGRGDNETVAYAKDTCSTCGVQDECLAYAMRTKQTVGVWGGKSEAERRRMRGTWTHQCVECHVDLDDDGTWCDDCKAVRRRNQQRESYLRTVS